MTYCVRHNSETCHRNPLEVCIFREACSHQWINPEDPPISRSPYSPVIGPHQWEMKPGTTYRCQNCGELLTVPETGLPAEAEQAARALGISDATARRVRREIR
jgi:hypothetical protein